ncbi:putative deoxyribonuclease YcfH [Clostridium oryzae]|uniref:Putative deoxyribonuclease YcfH n=2 Tax=Clostridium oryzae TaxID=1450648 RepID=A0A1V4IN91_9CLOT|nr:putative deoxyribonuclease YcfH [Clostridium oryzae]
MQYDIFDSHAHYDDESFDEDRSKIIDEIKSNKVIGILNCGSSVASSKKTIELAKRYDFIYAAVGIHPETAYEADDKGMEEIRSLTSFNKVKAIGEIGLDYYYEENPPREIQKQTFIRHMQLAKDLRLPVIIHDRDAHQDTLEIIRQFPEVNGVVHCFSGSVEFAELCLKEGYYLGVTGVVTFKNAKKIIDVVKMVPLERLLVETDCPYMAPVPNRGKRNQSDYIKYIIEQIASIKCITPEEVSRATISNVKRMLNL